MVGECFLGGNPTGPSSGLDDSVDDSESLRRKPGTGAAPPSTPTSVNNGKDASKKINFVDPNDGIRAVTQDKSLLVPAPQTFPFILVLNCRYQKPTQQFNNPKS